MVNLLSFIDSVGFSLENAGFDVFIINPQHEIMYMNKQLKQIIKLNHENLKDIHLETYLTKTEHRDFENFVEISVNQKKQISFVIRQMEIYGEDMEITINPILDEISNIIGLTCSVRHTPFSFAANSITSRMYEENIHELLFQFTGGIAHKLNNILTAITGVVSLLQLDEETNQRHSSKLKLLSDSAFKASEYIEKLKALSKDDINNVELCNLNQIFTDVLDEVSSDIKIEYSISLTEEPISIVCNPCSIHEVFTNILLNAIESISDKGLIEISSEIVYADKVIDEFGIIHTDTKSKYGCFIIKDNGSGINHNDIHKIYLPYYSTKNEGRGMGLYIVSSIIHVLGGYIKHYSSEDGTRVKLVIPLKTNTTKNQF